MRIKAKAKNGRWEICVKAGFGESFEEQTIVRMSGLAIRGCFRLQGLRGKRAVFTSPYGISLQERLQQPITKGEFFFLVEQVIRLIRRLQQERLSIEALWPEFSDIYLPDMTKELQFLYIPLVEKRNSFILKEFLERLVYAVTVSSEDEKAAILRFFYFFQEMKTLDFDRLEAYIEREEKSVRDDSQESKPKQEFEETGLLVPKREEVLGLLGGEAEETTLLRNKAYLYRIQTEERIYLPFTAFRLGKENADYCVTDNRAVSRKHAEVVYRNGRYAIKDLASKNATYLNGRPLTPFLEALLQDQDQLLLGNEAFIFCEEGRERNAYHGTEEETNDALLYRTRREVFDASSHEEGKRYQ